MRPDLRSRRPTTTPISPNASSNRPAPAQGRTEESVREDAAALVAGGTVFATVPEPRMGVLAPRGPAVTLAMSGTGVRVSADWAALASAAAAASGFAGSGVAEDGTVATASFFAAGVGLAWAGVATPPLLAEEPVGVGLANTIAAFPAAIGVAEGNAAGVSCDVGVTLAAPVAPSGVGVALRGVRVARTAFCVAALVVGVAGSVVHVGCGVLFAVGVGDALTAAGIGVLVGVAVAVAFCPTLRFSCVTTPEANG